MTENGYAATKRKRSRLMSIGSKDVGGRVYVEVSISPKSAQDEIALAQVAQALRAPGTDGRPLMSDEDINRFIFNRAHPERVAEGVDMQMLAAGDQEVADIKRKAAVAAWKKRNSEIVKAAENPDGEEMVTMTRSELEEFVNKMSELKHAQMMGQDPTQMIGQAMMQAQGMQMPAGGAEGMPGLGAGMSQAAMPSQFQMTPADEIPEPSQMMARKARRGKPANNPKRARGSYR